MILDILAKMLRKMPFPDRFAIIEQAVNELRIRVQKDPNMPDELIFHYVTHILVMVRSLVPENFLSQIESQMKDEMVKTAEEMNRAKDAANSIINPKNPI